MRFSIAALFFLPAVLAQSQTTDAPFVITGELAPTNEFTDDVAYSSYLVAEGLKPEVASYLVGLNSNSAVESAIDEYGARIVDYDFTLPASLATATSLPPVELLRIEEAQITAVTDANARAILSSVFDQAIAIQTAAAAPTDLALSAGIAGVVAAAAGLAVAL